MNRKDTAMLTNISDVYTEIRSILGEFADEYTIEGDEFWAAVEANER